DTLTAGIMVSAVDSVQMSNGVYMKRFEPTMPATNSIIEGIGSVMGLMRYEPLYFCGPASTATGDDHLLCYDNPSFSYHPDVPDVLMPATDTILKHNCFDISVLYADNVTAKKDIKVYPNPMSDDDVYIDGAAAQDIKLVVIYDMTGR